jgi:LSD1 subclass zinc finger protein
VTPGECRRTLRLHKGARSMSQGLLVLV